MNMQAIVWLKQPIATSHGETTVVICNLGLFNEKHVVAPMNGGGSMTMEYRAVMTTDNADDLKAFLFTDQDGGEFSGMSDIRLSV